MRRSPNTSYKGEQGCSLAFSSCSLWSLCREPLPTMFSMLHPLDEITPLVCKSGGEFMS